MILWLLFLSVLDRTFWPAKRHNGIVRLANRMVTALIGVRVRQHSLSGLDPQHNYIFCMNHMSILDTPVLVQSIPFFTRAFQDIRHFKIPVYGSLCRMLGQLPVEKGNSELNESSHQQALEMLRRGGCFAVFPEGHRSRDGRLAAFYPGAFRLAIESQVPLIPVVTRGLRNLCPAKEWRLRPGKVDVLFGEPIPTTGLGADDMEALSRRTFDAMNELLLTETPEVNGILR